MNNFYEKMNNISKKEYKKLLNQYPYNVDGHWIRKFPYEFWEYLSVLSHAEFSLLIEKTSDKKSLSIQEIKKLLGDIALQFNNKKILDKLLNTK